MDKRNHQNNRPKTSVEGSKLSVREETLGKTQNSPRRGSEPRTTSFANPTLSSLNKTRPVAVIKAYDDISDHRSLLEKTKILSKLKSSTISSPMLVQRRSELEDIINNKSYSIIKGDLLMLAVDGREFIRILSYRFGDAAYRLEMASSNKIDKSTRIRAVENFVSASEERILQIKELEFKIRGWSQTLTSCREIAAEAKSSLTDNLTLLLEKSSIVYDVHKKNSFLWMDKIVDVNLETMCHYFDHLDFNEIIRICQIRSDLCRLAQSYGMTSQDYSGQQSLNEIIMMAQVAAKECVLSINQLFFNDVRPQIEDDDGPEGIDEEIEYNDREDRQKETDVGNRVKFIAASSTGVRPDSSCDYVSSQEELSLESLECKDGFLDRRNLGSLLSFILIRNQRVILRLFYALIASDKSRKSGDTRYPNNRQRKPPTRKTWKKLQQIPVTQWSTHDFFDYASVDQLFWQTFWKRTEELLVQEVVQLPIEEASPETKSFLEQLQKVIQFSSEFSSQALSSLERVYCRLKWRVSQSSWSTFQRNMISFMESFDSGNPTFALNSLTENKLCTLIGSSASMAVSVIASFITECLNQEDLTCEAIHCLTLTLNTFFNWLQCVEVKKFSIEFSIALIFSDMTSMIESLSQVSYYLEVKKFRKDVVDHREKLLSIFKVTFAEKCFAILTQQLPKRDYRSRSCPAYSNKCSWIDVCLECTLTPVLACLNQMQSTDEQKNQKVSFVDIFLESLLKIVLNDDNDIKFSVSGSHCFSSHMEYLTKELFSLLQQDFNDGDNHLFSTSGAIRVLRDFTMLLQKSSRGIKVSFTFSSPSLCRRKKISPLETTRLPTKAWIDKKQLNLLKCWCIYLPL
jgi:hypothetical protein